MNNNEKQLKDLGYEMNTVYDNYANKFILNETDKKIFHSIIKINTTLVILLERNISIPLRKNNIVSKSIIKIAKNLELCSKVIITDIIISYYGISVSIPFSVKEKDEILSETYL